MNARHVRIAGAPTHTTETVEVRNPYDESVLATVPLCGPEEVDTACGSAAAALARDDFGQHARAEVLERAAVLLRERTESFAQTIAAEAGKPIRTARGEVGRCVDTLTFAAVEARKLTGEMIPAEASTSAAGKVMFALRVPIGVVAAITPFNFPLNLVAHKIAPAVAAGCPVVLKPAPQTPLSAIDLVELLVEAGLPGDWISVVTDSRAEAAAPLVAHDIPRMVTFTGSVPVGWGIAANAPRKKVALELGSNSPVIIEPGTDVASVAGKIAAGGFGYSGQSCIAVQRVLVHEDIHDELRDALAKAVDALVVGDPSDEATDVGPMIAIPHRERVRSWIEEAVSDGGTIVAGGGLEGDILRPTVIDNPPSDAKVCREEVFGPVVTIQGYRDFDDALAMANDSAFGLHAGVFTNDLAKAMRAVRLLDFGGVLIGEVPTFRADQQPYGGVRDAGNTREGPAYTVEEMTELRMVSLPA